MTRTVECSTLLALTTVLCAIHGCAITNGGIRISEDLHGERERWSAAARNNPNDAIALAHLGVVYLKSSETKTGLKYLTRAGTLDRTNASIAFWEGEALLRANKPIHAMAAFKRGVRYDSTRESEYVDTIEPRLFTQLVQLLAKDRSKLNKVLSAVAGLSSTLEMRYPKTTAKLMESVGDIRFSRGSTHEALASFQRALVTKNASSLVDYKIGQSLAVLRRLTEAEKYFERWVAAASATLRPSRRFKIAQFLESRFLLPVALRWYERALSGEKNDSVIRRAYATALLKSKSYQRAENVLKPVLVGTKDDAEAAELGRLWLKFKRIPNALEAYGRAIELAPTEAKYWVIVARILRSTNDLETLEATIGYPNAHYRWGRLWNELGEWERASLRLAQAVSLPGGASSKAALLLARIHQKLGNVTERDNVLVTFVEKAQSRRQALHDVATLYTDLGVRDKAESAWSRALVVSPTDKVAAFNVAAIASNRKDYAAEFLVISRWASAHPVGTARAQAWLIAARHWMKLRRGDVAMRAITQALAQAPTGIERSILLLGATIEQRLRRQYSRAEHYYERWIAAGSSDTHADDLRTVADRIRGVSPLRRLRIRLLEELVQRRPEDARAFYTLGEAQLRLRPPNSDRARRYFERYISLSQKKVQATIRVGQKLMRYNAFRDAARLFLTIIPDDIEEPTVHLKLAQLFLRGSIANHARAANHVDQLLATVERPSISMQRDLLRLASQLDRAGLFQKAVAVLRRLQSSGRSNARVIRRLGRALLGQRKEVEAVTTFEEYIRLVGGRRAVREVGDAFYERGFYRRAKEYYLRLFSRSGRALLSRLFPRLIDTYLKLGDRGSIIALAKRYTDLLPNARAHGEAARRLQEAGLSDAAYEYWSKASLLQPNAVHFREQQARLALALGRLSDARSALDAMVSRTHDSNVWIKAGTLLSSRGYDAEALELYRRALAVGVDSTDVLTSKAAILARLNRLEEAQEVLIDALREAGDAKEVITASKEIYLPLAETARYRALLEHAMMLYPDRAVTWLSIGDLLASMGDAEGATRFWEGYLRKEPRGAVEVASRFARVGNFDTSRRLLERVIASPNADFRDQALSGLLSVLVATGSQHALSSVLDRFISTGLNPAQDMAALARGLSERGWIDFALRYLKATLAQEPIPDGWFRVARLLLIKGKVEEASSALDRYLNSESVRRPERSRTGVVAQQLGRVRQAALLWEEFGQLERALEVLDASVLNYPGVGTLHLHRARLRVSSDDILGALQALEGLLEGPTATILIEQGELDAFLKVVFQAGLQREVLSIISRIPEDGRTPELSTSFVRLALMSGETGLARAEVDRVLESSADGQRRFALGRAYFDAGMMLEARELLESVLEPGRGLVAAKGAIRLLVTLGRMQRDDDVIGRVIFLAGNVYEDRAELHRQLAEVFFSVGALEAAADQAEAWAGSVGAAPVGDKVLDETAPHPWRLQVHIALQQGDEDGAYRLARHFVDIAERPREARLNMATLLEHFDACTAARRLLQDDVAKGITDRAILLTLARLSLEVQEPLRAHAWFSKYLKIGVPSSSDRRLIARLWGQYGHFERAAGVLSKLSPVDPSRDDTAFLIRVRQGDSDAAFEEAKLAISSSKEPAVAATRLAARYLRSTEIAPSLALALANEALRGDPKRPHPLALLVRGAAYAEMGKSELAWADLQDSLDLGPPDEGPFIKAGHNLGPLRARQWSLAAFLSKSVLGQQLGLVKRVMALLTETKMPADSRYAALVLRETLTLTDGLDVRFTQSVAKHALSLLLPLMRRPEYIPALVDAVADLYERTGNLPAAIHVYQRAIRQFPDHASFSNNLAYVLARGNENLNDALALVETSISRNPEGAAAYLDTKGWILHRLGRNLEAAKLIEQSLRLMAGGSHAAISESSYHLGVVYLALGRRLAAQQAFYRAIRLDEAGVYGRKASEKLRSIGAALMPSL